MNCLSCSSANPAESKFCGNCGASLDYVRPNSTGSSKLEESFEGASSKPGSEYRKIAIGFTSILIIIVMAILVSISGSTNDVQTDTSNSTDSGVVEETQAPVVPAETVSEVNAKRKAESYLSVMGFSKTGLIDQLKFDGFSTADATYGVEHIVVNWDEQAAKKAKSYMDVMAFSANGLIGQLIFDGFTEKQAAYGAYMVGFRP